MQRYALASRAVKRLLFLGLLVTGCFNSHEIVTERAAREFRCPAGQVQTEELGGNAFRVWACGQQATYACSPRLGMCMREAGGVAAAVPAPAGPEPTPNFPPTGPPPFAPVPGPTGPGPGPAPAPSPTTPWETPPQ